jgi:hypothetical protein
MKTLEVMLTQHTPIIHFQPDQHGATLRASEVKPRLDRFIITKLGDGDYEKGKEKAKKEWLVGKGDHYALDYKLKIVAKEKIKDVRLQQYTKSGKSYTYWKKTHNNKTNKDRYEDFPFLLCNMGGKENDDELLNLSMYKEIELIFNYENTEIGEIIKEHIKEFFILNNFSQRHSKGFGSFTVNKIDNQGCGLNEVNDILHSTNYLEFIVSGDNQLEQQYKLFATIDFYWKCLKSGINYRDRYIKSFLWHYLNDYDGSQYTWEKRFIKQKFHLDSYNGKEKTEGNQRTPTFARALLGCPDKFEYINMHKTINVQHSENESSDDFIARIPSPIQFKPIFVNEKKVRVYIIINNNIKDKLIDSKNKKFSFKSDSQTEHLDIVPESIDYYDLIKKYHNDFFIYGNNVSDEMFKAMFESNDKDFGNYLDDNEIGDDDLWFYPFNFKGENILGIKKIVKLMKTK